MMKRMCFHCGVVLLAIIGMGCQTAAPTARAFSQVRLPNTSRDAAFDIAAAVMADRYPIARADRGSGVIVSLPVESREAGKRGRVRDLIGLTRRVRHTATTRVTGEGSAAEVWCKIVVERHDAQASTLFRNELRMNDAPTNTAADYEAATTTEQNEVWRTMRRDKRLERELLHDVEQSAAGALDSARP